MQISCLRRNNFDYNENKRVVYKNLAFKQKEVLIFDVDGTLTNSEIPQRNAWQLTADKIATDFGMPLIDIKTFYKDGCSNDTNIKTILQNLGLSDLPKEEVDKYRAFKNAGYRGIVKNTVDSKGPDSILVDGARAFLNEMKEHFKLIAASNSVSSEMAINTAQLNDFFSKYTTPITLIDGLDRGKVFQNPKPAPDIFLVAAKILGVEPKNCLVFEDSLGGAKAAEAANMEYIVIGKAKIPENKLRINQFTNFSQINISEFLKRLKNSIA